MTLQEKREYLEDFCNSVENCEDCPLWKFNGWSKVFSGKYPCIMFTESPENEIDKALEMIGYKEEPLSVAPSNPYWDRITAVANRQRSKGIKEYGKGVEDDTADINVRLDRIEEELIDALMYIEHLRDGISRIKEVVG